MMNRHGRTKRLREYKIAHSVSNIVFCHPGCCFNVPETKGSWRKYKKTIRKEHRSINCKVIFTWLSIVEVQEVFNRRYRYW